MTHPPRLRIAMVITELDIGGAERAFTQLALAAKSQPGRFSPEVYTLKTRPTDQQNELVERLIAAEIPVHFLDIRLSLHALGATRKLMAHFQRQQPQVVQSFLYHANVVATIAARRCGIRNVFTGLRVADRTWLRNAIERRVYPFSRASVAVSEGVAEFYRSIGLRSPIEIIPNGVQMDRFTAAPPATLELGDALVILCVGRLHEQKGLDWFLTCLPHILAKLPQHHAVFVGDGPQRDALIAQAKSLGIIERVHFLGWRPDVPELMKRAQLLVLPSRYEGMPNVLLEAMAAGLPLVTTRVQGTKEILGERWGELSCEFNDGEGMIERVIKLACDENHREELAAWGEQRMREHFSVSAVTEKYFELWTRTTAAAVP